MADPLHAPFDARLPYGLWCSDALVGALREVLLERLRLLADDDELLDWLLQRVEHLREPGIARWGDDMKRRFKSCMLDAAQPFSVIAAYPTDQARIPAISLIVASETEGPSQSAGDGIREGATIRRGTSGRGDAAVERYAYYPPQVFTMITTIQVTAWAEPDAFVRVLANLAMGVLRAHYGDAQASGIKSLTLANGGEVHPVDPQKVNYGNSAFTIRVTWDRVWFTRRAPVPVQITTSTGPCGA